MSKGIVFFPPHCYKDLTWTGAEEWFLPKHGGPSNKKKKIFEISKFLLYKSPILGGLHLNKGCTHPYEM